MPEEATLLDRAVPDSCDTTEMPVELAVEVDHLAGRSARWAQQDALHPVLRARALLDAGRPTAARDLLSDWRPGPGGSTQLLAAACWTASRVGPREVLDPLAEQIDALPDGFLIHRADRVGEDGPTAVPLGCAELLGGCIAAARGDLGAAQHHLGSAVITGDRRAPLWGALARVELARVLLTAADLGDRQARARAESALGSAATFFGAGGYSHMASVTDALRTPGEPSAVACPGVGHMVREVGPATETGPCWSVGFGVQPPASSAERTGLWALRHLIANRDRVVPAVELAEMLDSGSPQTALDPGRLRELIAEEILHDDGCRSRITKLLRRTIRTLAEAHPLLGAHLDATVHTGHLCRYEGDPGLRWRLEDEPQAP